MGGNYLRKPRNLVIVICPEAGGECAVAGWCVHSSAHSFGEGCRRRGASPMRCPSCVDVGVRGGMHQVPPPVCAPSCVDTSVTYLGGKKFGENSLRRRGR